jgi:hypothetical protein
VGLAEVFEMGVEVGHGGWKAEGRIKAVDAEGAGARAIF